MSELKNCPFCGGIDIDITDDFYGCHVYCISCHAKTKDYWTKEETIEAWNTRADGWISVKERLPEKNEKVMIYVKNCFGHYYIDIARLEGKKKDIFRNLDVNYGLEEVAYWQPLPEPPKGD